MVSVVLDKFKSNITITGGDGKHSWLYAFGLICIMRLFGILSVCFLCSLGGGGVQVSIKLFCFCFLQTFDIECLLSHWLNKHMVMDARALIRFSLSPGERMLRPLT